MSLSSNVDYGGNIDKPGESSDASTCSDRALESVDQGFDKGAIGPVTMSMYIDTDR